MVVKLSRPQIVDLDVTLTQLFKDRFAHPIAHYASIRAAMESSFGVSIPPEHPSFRHYAGKAVAAGLALYDASLYRPGSASYRR
ncbi:hypothetical protein HZA99_02090 [Candidatus Woesearchaeota archaeon]|nr:hypothetical protein [Candidatus Woesearchaeota archaeon]